jgi:hypothetical protein
MTKIKLLEALALVICLLNNKAIAQEINVSGEYRLNPVYSRGFREPMYKGDKPSLFTMQRTRLAFRYNKEKDLETEFIMQDRRFWGEQNDRSDIPNIAVFRAWAEKYFTPAFSARLGRQGFVYNDQQILGDPNWVGTRAHDAALFKYEKANFKAHLAAAHGTNGQDLKWEPYTYNMYRNMEFLWLEKSFNKNNVSFIFLNRGMEKPDSTVAYTQTFGPYTHLTITNKLSFKGLYYYQMGKEVNGLDVSASLFSTQLFYSPTDNVIVNAGMDVTSGTSQTSLSDPENTKSHTFDRLYGLHHGKFGYIDYFYVNNPTLCGIHDYYIKVKAEVAEGLVLENHLHNFATSATLNNASDGSAMNKQLGIENDILFSYKFSNSFKATVAHSIMFGTPTLDQFFGAKKSIEKQVFYAVITATPTFFKSKPE